jgi:hypothetical protein
MLGVALFPMTNVGAAQQWLAHPERLKSVTEPEVLKPPREESAAVWPAG